MTTLLAVDPGLRYPAAAWFVNGVLHKASRVKVKYDPKQPILERCRDITICIAKWCNEVEELRSKDAYVIPDKIIVEYPQIYTREKSKGDPNNLIPLACIGACLSGLYVGVPIMSPKPREWTGNVPKDEDGDPWKSPRGQRVWDRLSPAERACVIPSHDAVDAVGLGLFCLGRFERRRVFSRS